MANKFQTHTLKKRFNANNIDGADVIDWDAATDKNATFDENVENLRQEYPGLNFKPKENFDEYARSYLKTEGLKMGLTISCRAIPASSKPKVETSTNELFETVINDLHQSLILVLGERGSGKSTSLKALIAYAKEHYPSITWKVFDPSLSHYKKSPLRFRQLVTMDKIAKGLVSNTNDTVYEIGQLNEAERRAFVATVIGLDYKLRYQAELKGISSLPLIVYLVEESNCIFGSFSFRKNDPFTPILQDFVSIGRNMSGGMSAILVATREVGELSPSLRDRSRRLYTRVIASGDINEARRLDKSLADKIKNTPKYSFYYHGTRTIGPTRVRDTVTSTPEDYTVKTQDKPQTQTTFNGSWWLRFLSGLGIFFMFCLYLRGL